MITKEMLSNYAYIEKAIESTKKSIQRLENNPPKYQYDRVVGSSSEFPYTKRNYNLSGYSGREADLWNRKILRLKDKLAKQLTELDALKLEIEDFVSDIPDLSTRLIFKYIYIDGLTQLEVAEKLHMEQCTISKRISKHLELSNRR